MSENIIKLALLIYHKCPFLRPYMAFVRRIFFPRKPIIPKFSGWGMTTEHELPWNDAYDWEVFRKTSSDVKNFELGVGAAISKENIDTLLWRHWIVSYAVRHAIKFAETNIYNFVECGVADGVSAFFSLREIFSHKNINNKSTMHLYDSWSSMKQEDLLPTESSHIGRYSDLTLNRTQKNLTEFKDNLIYHQGYIPDSFNIAPESPKLIIYLHIDLNSAKATLDTLNFFLPRLVKGGIVLFDDYAFDAYTDTKNVIDKFFSDKTGILLKLPTGQAIYYIHT